MAFSDISAFYGTVVEHGHQIHLTCLNRLMDNHNEIKIHSKYKKKKEEMNKIEDDTDSRPQVINFDYAPPHL